MQGNSCGAGSLNNWKIKLGIICLCPLDSDTKFMRYNLKWPFFSITLSTLKHWSINTWEKLVWLIQVNRNHVDLSTCNHQFYSSNISKLNQTFSGLLYHSSCKLGTAGLSTNKSTTERVAKYIQLRHRQDKRLWLKEKLCSEPKKSI